MRIFHDNNFVRQAGRLADVPSVKKKGDKINVANFRICVTHMRQTEDSDDNDPKYEVSNEHWINVEAWDRTAETAARLLKGQLVIVEGELLPEDDYTKDGVTYRGAMRIRAQRIYPDLRDISDFKLRERKGPPAQHAA